MTKLIKLLESNIKVRNAFLFFSFVSWVVVCFWGKRAEFLPWISGSVAILIALLWPLSNAMPRVVRAQVAISIFGLIAWFGVLSWRISAGHPIPEVVFGNGHGLTHAADWKEYRRDDIGFAIAFPGSPIETQVPFGNFKVTRLRSELASDALYQLEYLKLSKPMDDNLVNTFLDSQIEESIEAVRRTGKSVEIIQHRAEPILGYAARESRFNIGSVSVDTQAFIINQVFYKLVVSAHQEPKQDEQKFFNSFRLLVNIPGQDSGPFRNEQVLGKWHVEKVICSSNGADQEFYNQIYFSFGEEGHFSSVNVGLTNNRKKNPNCSSGEKGEYKIINAESGPQLILSSSIHKDTCGGLDRQLPARVMDLSRGPGDTLKLKMERNFCDGKKGLKTWVLKRAVI